MSVEPTAHSPPMPSAARKKTENQKMPPSLRKKGEACECGVSEHSEGKRAAPPNEIAEPAEKCATERPADEEGSLNPGGFFLHRRIAGVAAGGKNFVFVEGEMAVVIQVGGGGCADPFIGGDGAVAVRVQLSKVGPKILAVEKHGDEGNADERVNMHIQPVEKPAEPCSEAALALFGGDGLQAVGHFQWRWMNDWQASEREVSFYQMAI
jgi:hypothetical protein